MPASNVPSYAKTDTSSSEPRPKERVSQQIRMRSSPQPYSLVEEASAEMTDMVLGSEECYVDT